LNDLLITKINQIGRQNLYRQRRAKIFALYRIESEMHSQAATNTSCCFMSMD